MGSICDKCGSDRPAGLSDMGMEALEAFNAGRRAIHAVEYEPASFRSAEVTRTEAFAFWKAARAPLEAENKALRERVRELERERDGTGEIMRKHLDFAIARAQKAEAQLAQAQKPAVKSLADMIAESTTLAMGQRTAALETMIREFISQTGAKVEDCVLVEQMEDTKLTWHIEHRPVPAGLPESTRRSKSGPMDAQPQGRKKGNR